MSTRPRAATNLGTPGHPGASDKPLLFGWDDHLHGKGAVARLEARLRELFGMTYALTVSNATCGLYALADALDLRDHDVVVPALSWGGTVAGVLRAGARPIFADVDPVTLAITPEAVLGVLTPKTRAVVAVDLFGVPADDLALRRIADDHGLWYIHDAAQSFGARCGGRPAGTAAHASVLSFTIGKALSAGEGGAVLTDDRDLYERVLWMTQHPYRQKRELGLDRYNEFALNMRINPLAAALALEDVARALDVVQERREWANGVIRVLDGSGLTESLDYVTRDLAPSFHALTASWSGRPRPAALRRTLDRAGLEIDVHPVRLRPLYQHGTFRLLHPHPVRARCPMAERQCRRRIEVTSAVATPPVRDPLDGDSYQVTSEFRDRRRFEDAC